MQDELANIKPDATIIEGFPGFGLIGSIVTEYLIGHLQCKKITSHYFEELPASLAIHEGNVIEPLSVFYNEEYNIVIVHSIISGHNIEWKAAEYVHQLAQNIKAREIVCIEGVGSNAASQSRTFYHCVDKSRT